MVDVAQLAERQIVVLDVVGSTPTIHPSLSCEAFIKPKKCSFKYLLISKNKYTLLLYLKIV